MKIITLLFATLILSSCISIDGKIQTYVAIQFKINGKKEIIKPGTHEGRVTLRSKRKLVLTFTNGEDKNITFKLPKGTQLPPNNGEISLSSEESGKPFDLLGSLKTDFIHGPKRYERENCSIPTKKRVCKTDRTGRRVCETRIVYRPGRRDVESHLVTTKREVFINLFAPNTKNSQARFDGKSTSIKRTVDYQGPCF